MIKFWNITKKKKKSPINSEVRHQKNKKGQTRHFISRILGLLTCQAEPDVTRGGPAGVECNETSSQ